MNKSALAASLARPPRNAQPAPEPVAPVAVASGDSARKVRITCDVVRPVFRDFATWRDQTADQLGRSRLTAQDTLRVMIGLLLDDPGLQQAVCEQLRREAGAS